MKDKIIEQFKKILKQGECNSSVQLEAVYNLIQKSEESGLYLQIWAEDILSEVNLGEKKKIFKNNVINEWNREYLRYFNSTMNCIIEKNFAEELFYKNIWKSLLDSVIFDNAKEKLIAFYMFSDSEGIPYCQLGQGIQMENGIFKKKSEEIYQKLVVLNNIYRRQFNQRTEKASLINRVFQDMDSEEDKAVLMAHFLKLIELKEDNKV